VAPAGSVSVPDGVRDPAADPALKRYYSQSLKWASCKDGLECATLTVPVDWARPDGEAVGLAVARRKARSSRIGALVFNPGGPGVAVLPYVEAARQLGG
jgi:hypothetical protein